MRRVLSSILIILISISATAQNNKYSVGRMGGTVNVGELGNATFSLPIEIPECLGTLKPDISIHYNSMKHMIQSEATGHIHNYDAFDAIRPYDIGMYSI